MDSGYCFCFWSAINPVSIHCVFYFLRLYECDNNTLVAAEAAWVQTHR